MERIINTMLFCLICHSAYAANFYADGNLSSDCTGGGYSIESQDCSGSAGNAYDTIQEVFDNNDVDPSDNIYVRAGTYRESLLWGSNDSGSAAGRVTLSAYNSEAAKISGADLLSSWSGTTGEEVTDSGMETWSDVNTLTNWTWATGGGGTTTLNQESSTHQFGTYCARVDLDALQTWYSLEQSVALSGGVEYTLSFWHKQTGSAAFRWRITYTDGSTYYLQDSGEWTTSLKDFNVANSTTWTQGSSTFTTPSGSHTYTLMLTRFNNSASQSHYFDGVQIQGTATSNNTYRTNLQNQTHIAIFDDSLGTPDSDFASLSADNEWFWDNGAFYIYSTTDPSTKVIEAGQRNKLIDLNQADYINIEDLTLYGSQVLDPSSVNGDATGIYAPDESEHVRVENCTLKLQEGFGIRAYDADDWDILSSNFSDFPENFGAGGGVYGDAINFGADAAHNSSTDIVIGGAYLYGNTFSGQFGRGAIVFTGTENSEISYNTIGGSYGLTYQIDLEPNWSKSVSNITLKYNSYNHSSTGVIAINAFTTSNTLGPLIIQNEDINLNHEGHGIQIDGVGANSVLIEGCTIRDARYALSLKNGSDMTVQHNKLDGGTSGYSGIHINPSTAGTVLALYNVIIGTFQNGIENEANGTLTAYGNSMAGFTTYGIWNDGGAMTAKNNAIYSSDSSVILVRATSGSVLDYNQYYSTNDTDNIWRWDATTDIDDIATWRTVSSQGANSQWGDPLFASSTDLSLQNNSPCIGEGENLGASYDDALDLKSVWASNVLTVYQDDYGAWEIGAFAYYTANGAVNLLGF